MGKFTWLFKRKVKNLGKMKWTCPIQFMFVSGVLPIHCYFALNALVFLSGSTHVLIIADLDRKQAQIKPKPTLRAVITGGHKSDGPLPLLANLSVEYSASSTSCLNLATSSHHIRTNKTGYQYICISVLLVRWRILFLDVQPARVKTKAVNIHESSPIVRIDDTNGSKNMHNKSFFLHKLMVAVLTFVGQLSRVKPWWPFPTPK